MRYYPLYLKDIRKGMVVAMQEITRKQVLRIYIIVFTSIFICVAVPLTLWLIIFHDSHRIVKVEIGSFPDSIVYFAGESDTLDLTGGTVLIHIRGTRFISGSEEDNVTEHPMCFDRRVPGIVYDVDFSVPGVYEIHLIWFDEIVGRIPIQVIERELE